MTALQKQYLYKFSRNGVFLGVLQNNVFSQFNYSLNINSPGSQLLIKVGQNPSNSSNAVDTIITESGEDIITESGDTFTTERTPDIVGNSNSQSLIRDYNDVQVYEFSANNPNGKLVFNGYISKYTANYGGSGIIEATVISYGTELDNYLILGTDTADQVQSSTNGTFSTGSYGKDASAARIIQSFVVGASVTNFSGQEFKVSGNSAGDVGQTLQYDVYASLSDAENGTNSLGTTTQAIQSTSLTVQKFSLAAAINVNAGSTYYGRLKSLDGIIVNFNVAYQNTDLYANGQGYYSDGSVGGGGGGGWTTLNNYLGSGAANDDFYFKTYFTGGATSSPFTSQDPSTILTSIIDSYVSRGGTINYGSGTVVATGLSVSYTFKVNTILEGIQKCLDLAPYDWYYYIDPATNVLYFKEASTTAEHTMILGRHIQELNLTATVEQLKNQVYFSGGDTGGSINLFMSLTSANSLATNNVGMARISDNRVTLSATATAIMQSFLNENSSESYNSTITILESTYDISLFKPGQMIGFAGFGNFIDRLLLQIVGLTRYPDSVQLKLGVLPPRTTSAIEDALSQIADIQTINNPSAPS